ncbi:probable L-lactate dehydrogenase (cytochrome) [Fusarium mangiferae]|uniref:Probable L-lactate dehydrogenase (Cytochrome) n=1 Tax=Fusarium mangiferae TaxID=192010 RepID=A0A1L7U6S6_FUSMA|nr:putative L-lactate dehydrogenase (cytochrome) [Fusarium mangiferae]CVL06450.1 probable L-lactate dehydrogenase (cytochrome) [Fusarium mangiferae]
MSDATSSKPQIFSIQDLKQAASDKMSQMYRDYYNGGAMDNITLASNEAAFDRYLLRPRVLRNVSNIDMTTTLWGTKAALPLGVSPSAMHRLAHADGEVGTSKACAARHVPMILSALSNDTLEDVSGQSSDGSTPYAIQVSPFKNRQITTNLLNRAKAAGYKAVVLTVDAPMFGRRLDDLRNGFSSGGLGGGIPDLSFDTGATWEEKITWMKSQTDLEIWVKGVTSPLDAQIAIEQGVDGIIISNHGGRQLDTTPATIDILREIAPIAKGKTRIAIDGGFRRGSDIFKAVALGADFVFVGRIAIWGLAYDGSNGVGLALDLLINEFKLCMGLAGCSKISDITPAHLSILNARGVLESVY